MIRSRDEQTIRMVLMFRLITRHSDTNTPDAEELDYPLIHTLCTLRVLSPIACMLGQRAQVLGRVPVKNKLEMEIIWRLQVEVKSGKVPLMKAYPIAEYTLQINRSQRAG